MPAMLSAIDNAGLKLFDDVVPNQSAGDHFNMMLFPDDVMIPISRHNTGITKMDLTYLEFLYAADRMLITDKTYLRPNRFDAAVMNMEDYLSFKCTSQTQIPKFDTFCSKY